jgi:PAS domain S-box-containing protein
MNEKQAMDGGSPDVADLRRKAEQHVREGRAKPALAAAEADTRALVHELQVHQIELEMQNEELQRTQAAAEEASRKYGDLFDFAPVGYFLWDHEGRILEVNLAGAALLGSDRSLLVHKRFGQFVAPQHRATFADFCHRVSVADTKQTCQLTILKAGQTVDVLVEDIAAQDGQAHERLCRAAVIDISQQKRADELAAANRALQSEIVARKQADNALQTALHRFYVVLSSMYSAVLLVTDAGQVEFANQALCDQFGLMEAPIDLVGLGARDMIRKIKDAYLYPDQAVARIQEVLDRGQPVKGEEVAMRGGRTCLRDFVPLHVHGKSYGRLWLHVDITERKRAEQSLLEAKAAAEAASLAKSQFLANMSHELRTPMNAILGMIDVALPKTIDPTVHDCLTTAKGSADLLLTLLNDLLDSAKIESGKLELESAPFSLRRMVDQITRVLALRASEKGLIFSCQVAAEVPDALIGDQVRLRQVLSNLADNAIKFTAQGEVEISLRAVEAVAEGGIRDGGLERHKQRSSPESAALIPNPQSLIPAVTLEVAVRDTGIGIPPADLERIFQPFSQADASTTRRFGGTGLGLAICSNLVGLMGGHMGVESKMGKGSTFRFTVRLPLAAELPPAPETPLGIPAVALSKLRILLAEDNLANQKLATYILQERGHTVEVASDGQQAIAMTLQSSYDVILMDVQMPGMDGLETTAAIRAGEALEKRTPIIAMTAYAMKSDRQRCLAAGMDGYLSKPIDANEMLAIVESLAAGTAAVSAPLAPTEPLGPRVATVFDPAVALKRCLNRRDLLQQMIAYFFKDADSLLPQVRAALQSGDLGKVGRLGHRMKGTLLHLGAEAAIEAGKRVERFMLYAGERAEAEQAVEALERECEVLSAVLTEYRSTTSLGQGGP